MSIIVNLEDAICFRGEKIHCKNCDAVHTIEYEYKRWSDCWLYEDDSLTDSEIIEQKEFSKQFMPDYDAAKYGYYFHSFAICEKCFSEIKRGILIDKNHILERYSDTLGEIYIFCDGISQSIFKKMKSESPNVVLPIISPIVLEKIKNEKHFGIKKEKIRIVQRYLEELKNDFCSYVEMEIKKNEKYEILNKKVISLEKELELFLSECDETIEVYFMFEVDCYCNHNSYICYNDNLRKSETVSTKKLYSGPYIRLKQSYYEDINNKEKFKCVVDKILMDDFFNRLPVKLVKSDFFDIL